MNIFITLGSQKFQFNRLLEAIDALYENNENMEKAFAQIGYSTYIPKHFKYKNFLDRDEFMVEMSKADIIITHGGSIIEIPLLSFHKFGSIFSIPQQSATVISDGLLMLVYLHVSHDSLNAKLE